MLLAVYGTLRREGGAHVMLKLIGAEHVADGWVEGFRLFAKGVPYAVKGKGRIRVEVYEVPDDKIGILDFYESGYVREEVDVKADDGRVIRAQMYVWPEEVIGAEELTCGDWVKHIRLECSCGKRGGDRSSL